MFLAAWPSSLLKAWPLNGWGLFWTIAACMSAAVALAMPRADLANPLGVSSMIQLSVRVAFPWLFL